MIKADRKLAIAYVNELTDGKHIVDSASIIHESKGLIEFCMCPARNLAHLRLIIFSDIQNRIEGHLEDRQEAGPGCCAWRVGMHKHVELYNHSQRGIVLSICDRN